MKNNEILHYLDIIMKIFNHKFMFLIRFYKNYYKSTNAEHMLFVLLYMQRDERVSPPHKMCIFIDIT